MNIPITMKERMPILILAALLTGLFSCTSQQGNNEERNTGQQGTIDKTQAPDGHNSMNSVDWSGVYKGILPCADCEGIETTIALLKDNTFNSSMKYLGKDDQMVKDKGTFVWDGEASRIILTSINGSVRIFQVGENVLLQLDQAGNRITGKLAEKYSLKKARTDVRLEGKRWTLTKLMGQDIVFKQGSRPAFLMFSATTATFSGSGSCNNLSGQYELMEGNRISFGKVHATMMSCQDMETERTFMEVLARADNYSVTDSTLSLSKARMSPLAVFRLEKGR
jgi:heat shock protein HslJ